MGREKALSPLCMTRWGERLHAWSRFSDVYQVVIITLEVIIGLTNFPESQETFDPSTKSKARILINSLTSSEFIVAQESLKVIMSKLEATTKALQGPTENILSAYQSINALINLYANMRSDVDDLFDNIWKECQWSWRAESIKMQQKADNAVKSHNFVCQRTLSCNSCYTTYIRSSY